MLELVSIFLLLLLRLLGGLPRERHGLSALHQLLELFLGSLQLRLVLPESGSHLIGWGGGSRQDRERRRRLTSW
jgi:hypothetical protein